MNYDAKVAPYIHRARMRRRAAHQIGVGIVLAIGLVILNGVW